MVGRDKKAGNPVGDVTVLELPRDAQGRAHQARIPYLWIFEGTSKEEVGFLLGTYFHQQKQVTLL